MNEYVQITAFGRRSMAVNSVARLRARLAAGKNGSPPSGADAEAGQAGVQETPTDHQEQRSRGRPESFALAVFGDCERPRPRERSHILPGAGRYSDGGSSGHAQAEEGLLPI